MKSLQGPEIPDTAGNKAPDNVPEEEWGKIGERYCKNDRKWEKMWRLGENWRASQPIPNPSVGRG